MPSNMFYANLIVSQVASAAVAVPTVTLNNGVEMPMVSLGTSGERPDTVEESVRTALKVGFTAVDTAWDYYCQESIGRAVAEVERSSVFVTTKIGDEETSDQSIAFAYNRSLEQAYTNLKELNMDYVDLLLLHFPALHLKGVTSDEACEYMQEQWRALEDFMGLGKARAIGVSNYCISDLSCILETASVVPAVNQLCLHVGMGPDPQGLFSHNKELGIQMMAWSPLGSYDFTQEPVVYPGYGPVYPRDDSLKVGNFTRELGQHYGKSGAQVALRWLTQRGIALATSSKSEKHLLADLEVFDFTIDDTDMQQLDAATTPVGVPNGYWQDAPACDSAAAAITV